MILKIKSSSGTMSLTREIKRNKINFNIWKSSLSCCLQRTSITLANLYVCPACCWHIFQLIWQMLECVRQFIHFNPQVSHNLKINSLQENNGLDLQNNAMQLFDIYDLFVFRHFNSSAKSSIIQFFQWMYRFMPKK